MSLKWVLKMAPKILGVIPIRAEAGFDSLPISLELFFCGVL